MSSAPQSQAAPQGNVFSIPAFRTIWMGQFVSIFGDFVAIFAVISMITFRWHGSPTQVTIAISLAILPLAVIGPPAGVLVDHWNVKRVMIGSDLSRAVIAVLLAWMTNSWQLGMVLFALGCASSLFVPAQSIAVRTLIPRERLLQANAMLMQAFYLIRIISPLIAAAIVSALSEKACFFIDAGSFAFSALMISTLTIHRPPREGADKTLSGLSKDFVEGNRFIFTHPGLSFVFLAMAIAMFVMSSFAPLISIFVRDVLHAATRTYGVVSSCIGVGMIVGTTLVTRISRGKARPGVVVGGMLTLAVGVAVLAASRVPWQAGVSTFLMGFSIAMVLIPAQTMSQQETPPQMVGRVSSTFMSMISIAQVLGMLLSGSAAQKLGMQRLFAVCAGALVVIAAAGWTFLRVRRQPQAAAA